VFVCKYAAVLSKNYEIVLLSFLFVLLLLIDVGIDQSRSGAYLLFI
jgi:hypothetical protein